MPPRTKVDARVHQLVALLNGLGLGETTASCDGHQRRRSAVFVGYELAPVLRKGVLPVVREGTAMDAPAYVDIRMPEDDRLRGILGKLAAFLMDRLSALTYVFESESVQIEVRPGDKLQISFPHEWSPREQIFRSVQDLEMRLKLVRSLVWQFDPRTWAPTNPPKEIDLYGNALLLSEFSRNGTYPLLDRVAIVASPPSTPLSPVEKPSFNVSRGGGGLRPARRQA